MEKYDNKTLRFKKKCIFFPCNKHSKDSYLSKSNGRGKSCNGPGVVALRGHLGVGNAL